MKRMKKHKDKWKENGRKKIKGKNKKRNRGRKGKIEKERHMGKNEYKKHRVSLMKGVREKRKR